MQTLNGVHSRIKLPTFCRQLKSLAAEGFEPYDKIVQLKLPRRAGKAKEKAGG